MLIVDDNPRWDTSAMFKDSGVDVEVVGVKNAVAALEQLEQWASEGHGPDLITIDYLYQLPNRKLVHVGPDTYQVINNWMLAHPELERPKIFYHSGAKLTENKAGLSFHPDFELTYLHLLGAGDYGNNELRFSTTPPLLRWLNLYWETNFPLTKEQLTQRCIDAGLMPVDNIAQQVENGEIDYPTALRVLNLSTLRLRPQLDPGDYAGYPEGFFHHTLGAVSGRLAFDMADVDQLHRKGHKAILVVEKRLPEIISVLPKLAGFVVLGEGGEHDRYIFASHGIPAAFHAQGTLRIIERDGLKYLTRTENSEGAFDPYKLAVGAEVCLENGDFCEVGMAFEEPYISEDIKALTDWSRSLTASTGGLNIKANADTAEQVRHAIAGKARGIGLVRTEHMFFTEDRLPSLQRMLQGNEIEWPERLASFQAAQSESLRELFAAAKERKSFSVRVRLLDAPPEEFLNDSALQAFLAEVGTGNERGVQLALQRPGLYGAQAAAIFEAAMRADYAGPLEIMVPLVRTSDELACVKGEVAKAAEAVGYTGAYRFGAMIETVQAVEQAGEIAALSDFLSFGTNDLTAEITGCGRLDIEKTQAWMTLNNETGVSPFLTLSGPVREAMRRTVETARTLNPDIDISICGDQVSGNYDSIRFCDELGLDSISVSPNVATLIESQIMAGKACASRLPEEKLQERLRKGGKRALSEQAADGFASRFEPGSIRPENNGRDSRGGDAMLGF